MVIGVDARELFGQPTGVGRYLAELLARWKDSPGAARHTFHLYTPTLTGASAAPPVLTGGSEKFELIQIPGRSGTWWQQVSLAAALRRHPVDVLFAPGYTAPLLHSVPVVLTIHDVSCGAHPEWFGWREGARLRFLTRRSARKAAIVLTDSEFSRQEIQRHICADTSRVQVVRLGAPPVAARAGAGRPTFSGTGSGNMRSIDGDGPVVLFVGSIFNRRHVPDLIRAFADVSKRHPSARLVIAGENRTHPRQDLSGAARDAGVLEKTTLVEYVADEKIAALYEQASVFVFLSEYEGFGFTPLEALAAGAPIVVADTAIAREMYQDAALFVPTGDVAATAAAISACLVDRQKRESVLANASTLLAKYSWDHAAAETMAALEAAARVRRSG